MIDGPGHENAASFNPPIPIIILYCDGSPHDFIQFLLETPEKVQATRLEARLNDYKGDC